MQQEQRRPLVLRVGIRPRGANRQRHGVENGIRSGRRSEVDVGRRLRARRDCKYRLTFELAVVGVMTVRGVVIRRVAGIVVRMRRDHHPDRQLTRVAKQGQEHEEEHDSRGDAPDHDP